jgi:hypothetical protein
MSDYLTSLIMQAVTPEGGVQPRVPSLFEPDRGPAPEESWSDSSTEVIRSPETYAALMDHLSAREPSMENQSLSLPHSPTHREPQPSAHGQAVHGYEPSTPSAASAPQTGRQLAPHNRQAAADPSARALDTGPNSPGGSHPPTKHRARRASSRSPNPTSDLHPPTPADQTPAVSSSQSQNEPLHQPPLRPAAGRGLIYPSGLPSDGPPQLPQRARSSPLLQPAAPASGSPEPSQPAQTSARTSAVHGNVRLPDRLNTRRETQAAAPLIQPLLAPDLLPLQLQVERPAPGPEIHINIGRIEIRAAAPPPTRNTAAKPQAPGLLTLEEYQRQRNGESRRS